VLNPGGDPFLDGLVLEVRQTERIAGERITPLAEQAP
jgi:hypothetical protein